MESNKNENKDEELKYVDFSTLFTSEEIKALTKKNRKIVFKDSFMGISKNNFIIYLTTFLISIGLIIIYLLVDYSEESKILVVLMSVGAV